MPYQGLELACSQIGLRLACAQLEHDQDQRLIMFIPVLVYLTRLVNKVDSELMPE